MNVNEMKEAAKALVALEEESPKAAEKFEKMLLARIGGSSKKSGSKRRKKPSINGAPLNLEGVDIESTDDDCLVFKHSAYSKGAGKYPLVDLRTAAAEIEAKGDDAFAPKPNAETGTRFVYVTREGGRPFPVGENLVQLAKQEGHL